MKIRENYNLRKIKVPKQFFTTPPSEKKIIEKRNNITTNPAGIYITINRKNKLLDGFASYLAAGSLKIERLNVRQLNFLEERDLKEKAKTTFVYGYHPGRKDLNHYVWRVPNSKMNSIGHIKKGDALMVATKYGPAPMIVTKVKRQEYAPSVKKVKTVIGRINHFVDKSN